MSEPVNLQLENRDDCLVIRTRGRSIIDKMPETFQAMAEAIRARPIRATLIDLSSAPGACRLRTQGRGSALGIGHGEHFADLARQMI